MKSNHCVGLQLQGETRFTYSIPHMATRTVVCVGSRPGSIDSVCSVPEGETLSVSVYFSVLHPPGQVCGATAYSECHCSVSEGETFRTSVLLQAFCVIPELWLNLALPIHLPLRSPQGGQNGKRGF